MTTAPPVPALHVVVVERPLAAQEISPASLCAPAHGAIASFVGVVRDHHHGQAVLSLRYECYVAMAERVLADIAARVAGQFGDRVGAEGLSMRLAHGFGEMRPGDVSLAVHVASAHRVVAFEACRAIVEAIKADVPIWKLERYGDGSERWLKGS